MGVCTLVDYGNFIKSLSVGAYWKIENHNVNEASGEVCESAKWYAERNSWFGRK